MTQQTQDPNNDASGQNGATGAGETPATPDSWDAWLATQPEAQRPTITALYEKQTAGLKSALENERTQRKDFERQLRNAAKAADDGSKAQQDLTAMADQLAIAERRADFFRDAANPKLELVGVSAAWTLMNADAERYFDRKGNPNFALLKEEHPYLFAQPKPLPKLNGGNGTQQQQQGVVGMNELIRAATGRTS